MGFVSTNPTEVHLQATLVPNRRCTHLDAKSDRQKWPEQTPTILVFVDGLGSLLKVPCGYRQLWLPLDEPVCKFGWIEATRSTNHKAGNLTLPCHAIDGVW